MAQPVKKSGPFQKPRSKTVKKRTAPKKDKRLPEPTKRSPIPRSQRKHKEYGTSKLEERFARDFLDKLGVKYVYQFKAESIGRYFDFYLPESNTMIEVDGDYYHSYGILYEDMTPTQKRNKRVDEQKTMWCLSNCIYLMRIWEHDINNNPSGVMERLEKTLGINREKYEREKEKNKRH